MSIRQRYDQFKVGNGGAESSCLIDLCFVGLTKFRVVKCLECPPNPSYPMRIADLALFSFSKPEPTLRFMIFSPATTGSLRGCWCFSVIFMLARKFAAELEMFTEQVFLWGWAAALRWIWERESRALRGRFGQVSRRQSLFLSREVLFENDHVFLQPLLSDSSESCFCFSSRNFRCNPLCSLSKLLKSSLLWLSVFSNNTTLSANPSRSFVFNNSSLLCRNPVTPLSFDEKLFTVIRPQLVYFESTFPYFL